MELVKELRIGNLLENFLGEVFECNIETLNSLVNGGNEFPPPKPIPLTEEWLLRFGFIRKYVSHTPYILNDISIYPTDANFYNIVYYKGVKIDDIILKSVSQLQNLYFSLTNNELKLIK